MKQLKPILALCIAVLCTIFLQVVLFTPPFNVSVDAIGGYQYTRELSLGNTSASVVDYQVEIFIDTAALISAGKMRNDCGDIRFFAADQTTHLSYWLQSGCNTTNTRFWIKIPSIISGSSTAYLAYGNPSSTSTSDGFTTMEIYEDMQSSPSCALYNQGQYIPGQQYTRLTRNQNWRRGHCEYSYNPGDGFYAMVDFFAGGGNGADAVWIYAYSNTQPVREDIVSGGYHFTFDEYQDRICFTKSTNDNGAGIGCVGQSGIDNSQWHIGEVYHTGGNAKIYYDGILKVNATDANPISKNLPFMGIGGATGGLRNNHFIREFAVARFSEDITVTVGPESQLESFIAFNILEPTTLNNKNDCDLGTQSTSLIKTCNYLLSVETNASNGYSIYSQVDGSMSNGVHAISPVTFGDTLATAGATEKYGVQIQSGNISGGLVQTTPAFTSSGYVPYEHTVNTTIVQADGPNENPTADPALMTSVTHGIDIAADTPAGFYSQRVTYGVIPQF